jgi:hypothetical protein
MKKNVLIFGLLSGLIITAMMVYSTVRISNNDFKGNMILGYATMLVAFSFIFVGIRNFRDKFNGGVVSFGKAFQLGLYITLIASTIYVLVWLVEYYFFVPDFIEKYTACSMRDAKASGASEAELTKQAAFLANYAEMYKNPLFVVLATYLEVLPIGLVISLISALILKKKTPAVATA